LGYLKGSSLSGLEEITCRGQKKQTLKNLFSFVNKNLIVALAFSLGSFAATSWSFFFAMTLPFDFTQGKLAQDDIKKVEDKKLMNILS
jgi:hypothetical protein